jgi:hypothetical protein
MVLPKPVLIDCIQRNPNWTNDQEEIDGKWYTARPLGTRWSWKTRLYHAWLILCGKASAFQYYTDRKDMKK